MKVIRAIVLALGMAALGYVIPFGLSSFGGRNWDESEAGWPGEWIDFSDAIDQASVIAVARIPATWRDEWIVTPDGRFQEIDVTIKWYVKGELSQASRAWVMSRRANGTTITLPRPGLDRVLFFVPGSGDVPVLLKVAQVKPLRMTELRQRLGAWVPSARPATQPGTRPSTHASTQSVPPSAAN